MRNKIIFVLSILMVLVIAMVGNSTKNMIKPHVFEKKHSISDMEYVPDEIIVKFKSGTPESVISKINSEYGTFVKYSSSHGKFKKIGIPKGKTVSEMVEIYSRNPNVEYAEPNYIAHALMVPNDPLYSYQWHLDNAEYGGIEMEEAWDISNGSGVIVAVVDTGIAYEDYQEFVDLPGRGRDYWKTYCQAPDLANTCFVDGYDFVNNDAHPNDDNSHGTHVAGTIAQSTNNGIGVAGVSFGVCLMPVKVLDIDGSGTYDQVAEGIYYAVDHGAQIISLSLGGSEYSETLENAVAYAYNHNVTVIAAAGNDGSSTVSYPAAYDDYVIAVGATQYDETLAPYSNYGASLDLVAPGGNLYLDQNNDGYGDGVLQNTFDPYTKDTCDFGYWFFQGTSMATPHVSGVAALVIANGNADANEDGITSPDEVRTVLQDTADDLGEPGRDDIYGYGLVNAYNALTYTPTSTTTTSTTTTSTTVTTTTIPEATTMHIQSIDMSTTRIRLNGWYTYATAMITIVDANNNPVENATVYGHWSGLTSDSDSGITDINGQVSLDSDAVKNADGTFTFTVDNVTHGTLIYNPEDNVETSDSITV